MTTLTIKTTTTTTTTTTTRVRANGRRCVRSTAAVAARRVVVVKSANAPTGNTDGNAAAPTEGGAPQPMTDGTPIRAMPNGGGMPVPPMMYPPNAMQGYAQQQQQGYYAPVPPAAAASKGKSAGSDVPAWMWVGLGVALATVGGKFFGAKKQDMQTMMMQQMMKQFTSQAGGGMPGGAPGGMPGGMPGGFPPFPGAGSPAVDVKPSAPKPAAAAAPATPKPVTPATPTPATGSAARGSATTTQPTADVGESVKSEFAGFSDEPASTPVVEPTPVASSPFFDDDSDEGPAGAAAAGDDDDVSEEDLEYMQNMIRNPEMQKLMYPYLPEFMRNPQTFEMLLSNPQYKTQLKAMVKQMKSSGVGPGMPGMGMPDINSPEVQEQFAQMGMKPEDVLTQIMSDPELAAAFQNPKIQSAVMDCSTNPMNITKYQDDPEIMQTFEKLAALFPQDGMGVPQQ